MKKNDTQKQKSTYRPTMFRQSLNEFKITKNIVLCGLMAALAVVLRTFATINFGPYVKIGFSEYPNRIVEFLFGPAIGAFFGAALDLIKFFVRPDGMFNPIYTLIALVSGLGGGYILYHHKPTLKRVFLAQLYMKLFINIVLNTLAMYITLGDGVIGMIPFRIVKNLIQLPIDTIILFIVLKYITKLAKRMGYIHYAPENSDSKDTENSDSKDTEKRDL